MTSASLSTADLLEAIAPAPEPISLDPERERNRRTVLEAAAVLHLFSPSQIRSRAEVSEPAALIIDDIVLAVGWAAEGLWTLKTDVRQAVLANVGSRAALAKLRALNPEVTATDVQVVFDRWLSGEPLYLARMAATELAALRTLAEWGLDAFADFPRSSETDEAWRRRAQLANFEQLAKGFVGRQRELEVLRSFAAPKLDPRPNGRCLMLHGSGGAGKSALVSRFVLEFFDQPGRIAPPFVYLALDDQTLDPSQPVTLLSAAVRQLEEQVQARDLPADAFDAFRRALSEGESTRRDVKTRGSSEGSQRERLRSLGVVDSSLNRSFAAGLRRLSEQSASPLLLIIDTFEEASYRPETDLVLLYTMLRDLLLDVPALRLLLVGRALPPGKDFESLGAEELALGDLDLADAIQLLSNRGFDEALARQATHTFGCNPLTLRLVAHAMEGAGPSVDAPSLAAAGEEVIRGYLYRRILNHIHDPLVRRLAHPGMVLRRVTPQLIAEVLAPVCKVPLQGPADAHRLFAELAREHTLVSRGADGALVYREEIRLPMLKLVQGDAPEEVASLHLAAAAFYARADDETSREEELYHLLMSGDLRSGDLTRGRFPSYVARRLAAAFDEFPPDSQVELAQLTRLRLGPSALADANRNERDAIVAKDVLYLLRTDGYEEALSLLQRPIDPGSPLGPLKVRVLRELGRPDDAEAFAREQVAAFPALGSRSRLAQLMWFAAQCGDNLERTRSWLERLLPVARKLPDLALVQTLAELRHVARPDQVPGIENELAITLGRLSIDDAHREDRMVRLALARMGPRDGAIWQRLGPELLYGVIRSLRLLPSPKFEMLPGPIAEILAGSSNPALLQVEQALDEETQDERWLERLVSLLDDALRGSLDRAAVGATFLLFEAEETSLAGSSLAGLEDELKGFSPDAPMESAS